MKPRIARFSDTAIAKNAKLLMRLGALEDITRQHQLGSKKWIECVEADWPDFEADLDGEYWTTIDKLAEMFNGA